MFDEEKKIKPYHKFKKDAKEITQIVDETWLRVENEMCKRQCVQSELFRQMKDDADLYPFWVYKGVMDDREREDHVELEDKVFKIGDPEGDACFPPNDWNCRCNGEAIDEDEVKDNEYKVLSNSEAKQFLDTDVDEQFRYNPANQGMMPNNGSYFKAMNSANSGNADLFDLPDIDSDKSLEGLSTKLMLDAKGLHYLINLVHDWKEEYEVNKSGDIIFQCKALLSNIRFTNNSLHEIQKHSRGVENIPDTVENPDEVWSYWADPEKQLSVVRNYIKFGKSCYIVQVKDGKITDAFVIGRKQANKYRKGVYYGK